MVQGSIEQKTFFHGWASKKEGFSPSLLSIFLAIKNSESEKSAEISSAFKATVQWA